MLYLHRQFINSWLLQSKSFKKDINHQHLNDFNQLSMIQQKEVYLQIMLLLFLHRESNPNNSLNQDNLLFLRKFSNLHILLIDSQVLKCRKKFKIKNLR